jgi:predicted DNA-binding mobile mystery protein A
MKMSKRKLMIEQLDRKINNFSGFQATEIPSKGWIRAIRTAMNMSLTQLAKKMGKTPQTVREIELREASKNITLKKLLEVAEVLDLKLVYGFVPNDGSIQQMIEKRANELARKIVLRTSQTMKLENQEVGEERLAKAINDRAEKIMMEMPRSLWD